MDKYKMILLGMIIGIALMIMLGVAPGNQGVGRYQVAAGGGAVYYVLDTQTGKIVESGGHWGNEDGRDEKASHAVENAIKY